jgi:hypothetical protein
MRFLFTFQEVRTISKTCNQFMCRLTTDRQFASAQAPPMASVRFADLQSRSTEFLDFTSLTPDEFQQLVPPFEGEC